MRNYTSRVAILISILIITACSQTTPDVAMGKWQAVSKVLYSIYGDLEVKKQNLSFTILGDFDFKIRSKEKEYLILETNKNVDCGAIIKLGPFDGKQMEFSVYGKSYSESELCAWGVYQSQM